MRPSTSSQVYALIWRYLICVRNAPISSLNRVLIWPGLILGIAIFVVVSDERNIVGQTFINFVPGMLGLTTAFHLYSFSAFMITDRANSMKSLLLCMGMRRTSYYIAHVLCILCLIMPVVLTISTLSSMYVFTQESAWITHMIFILTTIHISACAFVFTSLMTSTKFINLIYLVILADFLGLHHLVVWTVKKFDNWKRITLFFASISPYESIRLYVDSYLIKNPPAKPDVPMYIEEPFRTDQPVLLILLATVIWTVVAFSFSRWFDEVCPWQDDSAVKSPLFCIQSSKSEDSSAVDEQMTASNSKYFERRATNLDIGIEVDRVNKFYGASRAVDSISFKVYRGETTLLLGHNGAGKTTLMNIILNRLTPNGGRVMISNMYKDRPPIGVCPQMSISDDNLTVLQHLNLFCDIKSNLQGRARKNHIEQTLMDVSLQHDANKKPSELSGGMKRKLSLGMAFVGQSDVLILDEPSSGLDPDSRTYIWDTIRRYRSDRTVLLSTQHMEEADNLGDRIAIMSAGKIFCCGSSTFLKKMFGTGYKLRIECKRSRQSQIFAMVSTYFNQALRIDDISMDKTDLDILTNFVIELNSSESDYDRLLIELLERLETESLEFGIESFGLKCSSIEDVMLNTGKYLDNPEQEGQTRAVSRNHISALIQFKRIENSSAIRRASSFLYALLVKHMQTYRNDWFNILLLRIFVPVYASWAITRSFGSHQKYTADFYPTLLAYHFVFYPSWERSSKFKAIQLTSRSNFIIYWISQVCIDMMTMFVTIIALNIFLATSLKVELAPSVTGLSVHILITCVIILFGCAVMPFAYTLSILLGDYKVASGYYLVICFSSTLLNVPITILSSVLNIYYKYDIAWLADLVNYIFVALLPTDAIVFTIYGVDKACYFTCATPGNSSALVIGIIVLFLQILTYSALLYVLEAQFVDLEWYCNVYNILPCCKKVSPFLGAPPEVDKDVVDETNLAKNIIHTASDDEYCLIAAGLHKSYYKGVPVLEDLSFTVNKKECFGLLGVNGAGKSTTFSLLATERKPDSGKIWSHGYYSTQLDDYRKCIGYDPQSSPEMQLSPNQALYLMARLREVDEDCIPTLIRSILKVLDMNEHEHKIAKQLSGGTKRKLALAMSLIGQPFMSMFDEPTAGVDPLARRGVWELLKALRAEAGSSIVISSHAMEECEAICDRIAIMARGKLRCIGSYLHLHSKFTHGFALKIHLGLSNTLSRRDSSDSQTNILSTENQDGLIETMTEQLMSLLRTSIGSKFVVADRHSESLTIRINDNAVKRSTLLRSLRGLKDQYPNLQYTINDPSLEDIFIAIAREQLEAQNVIPIDAS